MENSMTFEEKKEAVLKTARAEGIVDVVTTGNKDGDISLGTVELATELVKKHKKTAYELLESQLESQA